VVRKGIKWETETIEIPISEFDFQHEFHDLVYGDGEKNSFIWCAHTKETNRLIKIRFVSEEQQMEEYDNNIVNASDILERVKQQYIIDKYETDYDYIDQNTGKTYHIENDGKK